MNLATYMQMTVTPLSDYTPERKKPSTPAKRKSYHKTNRTLKEQSEAFRNKAIAKYRAVMNPDGWTRTNDIDARLGREGGADRIMKKWIDLGLAERRPVGGVYHQARGFEWRFCDIEGEVEE